MVVVGVDLGAQNLCVATPKVHSLDVVLNSASKRTSEVVMGFTDEDGRLFATNARQRMKRNIKNTLTDFMRLLLRKWSDTRVHNEAQWWGPELVKLDGDRVGFKVRHNGEPLVLEGEQILAAFFSHIRDMAQTDLGTPVNNFSMAVPSYFTLPQRRALFTAAEIVGVNLIRITNSITACALLYGVSAKAAKTVLFMDIGAGSSQVGAARYYLPEDPKAPQVVKKFDMVVQASTTSGCRDMDRALALHFAKEIKSKFGLDITVRKNLKYMSMILASVEKLKKLLGLNKTSSVTIDAFFEGEDYIMKLSREDLIQISEPFVGAMMVPLTKACQQLSKLISDEVIKDKEIDTIELIGGGIRIPYVKEQIKKTLAAGGFSNVKLSTTLNGDETVAKGTALMGAMTSNQYRVREFEYNEIMNNPVSFLYNKTTGPQWKTIFKTQSKLPGCRVVKLHDSQIKQLIQSDDNLTGGIRIAYSEEMDELRIGGTSGEASQIPLLTVYVKQSEIDKHEMADKIKQTLETDQELVLMCKLDADGRFGRLDAFVTLIQEEEEAEPEKKTEEPAKDQKSMDIDPKKEDETGAAKDAPADAKSEEKGEKKADDAEAKKKPKKKKKKQIALAVHRVYDNEMLTSKDKARQLEKSHEQLDALIVKLGERKNTLEEMVYAAKDKLSDEYKPVVTSERAEEGKSTITAIGYWLEDEEYLDKVDGKSTEEACKIVLKLVDGKIGEIKGIVDPLDVLLVEKNGRGPAVAALKTHIGSSAGKAESIEWLTEEQKKKVAEKCSEVDTWLSNQLIEQSKLKDHQSPVLTLKLITQKRRELDVVCQPILNTPKPKPPEPPKEEKKAEPPADEAKPDANPEKTEEPEKAADPAAGGAGAGAGGQPEATEQSKAT